MKNHTQSASATDVKNRFGDYLHSVLTNHEPLLIEKHGKPVAVMIEYSDWKQGKKPSKKKSFASLAREFSENLAKKHPHMKSFSAADLINQIREEGG